MGFFIPHNMRLRTIYLAASIYAATPSSASAQVIDISQLSFQEFERIALNADPVVARFRAQADATRDLAVSESQLPDPQVRVGVINVPVNSFRFDEEQMTMKEIGFVQTFPAYGSLSNRALELGSMAEVDDAMAADRELMVLERVRAAWLELYYQFEAVALVQKTQKVFSELVKVAEARYRQGRGRQQDLISVQLQLSKLEDEVTSMELEKEVLMSELMRWLGAADVSRPTPVAFPPLPPLPPIDEIRSRLAAHPSLRAAEAQVEANRAGVEMARAMYRPMTMIDVSYGQRDFEDMPDMMSAMLSFSLPLFTSSRQDPGVSARRAEVEVAKESVEDRRRELQEMMESNYRRWQRLNERVARYEKEVVPFSNQYSQATLTAYQANVSDFEDQVEARMGELENGLTALRLKVDRAKTHATLLYIAGERAL